jgi:acetolactate synthase-1/2/3 large subunit
VRKGSDLLVAALLVPTLEAAFAEGGMHLVAVPIDDAENTRVLVEEPSGRLPEVEPA